MKKRRTFNKLKNLDSRFKKHMKKIKYYIILAITIANISLFGGFVLADNPGTAPINIPNPIGDVTLLELIDRITNYLMWIAIVLAPMMIIIAAFTFLTAGGNERKVETAKKMLTWAIVGAVLVLVSKGIVSLIKDFLGSTI